ncbi:MAG: MoxR family ATPase [Gammaproteobacteria bacterium]|nr:MoxR family ATPase [Gammaproteobacteria bacterium]
MSLHKESGIPPEHAKFEDILHELDGVILGKPHQMRLALACLLAKGHLLIEDLPGMGKTTLAHSLAAALGLEFNRIQFTSDLLPADILGVSIFQTGNQQFKFHPGPIFSQLILADEINRATPKTQSALLEAMEERQISSDGETFLLPEPFFVIATQNPQQLIGTFPLPESQLDRFLMRISLGYPDRDAERQLLRTKDRSELIQDMGPGLGVDQLRILQNKVRLVHCSDALLDYVQDILEASRTSEKFVNGLSPRAGLALLNSARAWAFLEGRSMVLPEDIQTVAPAVMTHRLQNSSEASANIHESVETLLNDIPIP